MIIDDCKYTCGFRARFKGLTKEQANAIELYAIDYVTANETRVISNVLSYDGENHEIQFAVLLYIIAYNQSNIEDEKACAEAYLECLEEWKRLRYQIINVIKESLKLRLSFLLRRYQRVKKRRSEIARIVCRMHAQKFLSRCKTLFEHDWLQRLQALEERIYEKALRE